MRIPEEFLHYVWRFRLFNQFELKTQCGRRIEVIDPGQLNEDAGPDFSLAKIKFDNEVLIGSVEMHVEAKGWYDHHHDKDPAYDSVILHVVWHHYLPVYYREGQEIPALMLKSEVDVRIVQNFGQLRQSIDAIPCAGRIAEVSSFKKMQLLERMAIGRLAHRYEYVLSLLENSGGDWERVTFILLCRAMGMRVNKDVFVRFAEAFPYRLFGKYHENFTKIEALVFGQAGMLHEKPLDAYHDALAREYGYLSQLHGIGALAPYEWKYMRMRPANFPTIRLAQLSAIYHAFPLFFGFILTTEDPKDFLKRLSAIQTNPYWDTHYRFGVETDHAIRRINENFASHIVINVCALVLFSYGKYMDAPAYMDRALLWLQAVKAEKNAVTRLYGSLGFSIENACDSQATIYLKHRYCDTRRCLDCTVGLELIKG